MLPKIFVEGATSDIFRSQPGRIIFKRKIQQGCNRGMSKTQQCTALLLADAAVCGGFQELETHQQGIRLALSQHYSSHTAFSQLQDRFVPFLPESLVLL